MTASESTGAGADRPFTIVLGDGLDEEVLSPQVRHLDSRASVGEREIERLFGRGRGFGRGPLPAFLQLALAEQQAGGRVGVVLLERQHEPTSDGHVPSATRLVPPLDEIAREARVIGCPPGRIPWDELRQAVLEQTGADPGKAAGEMMKGDKRPSMAGMMSRRMTNAFDGPDYERIAPRGLRNNPAKLVEALVFRFFQGPVPAQARKDFELYAEAKKGAIFTNKEVGELCHLMMSTPYYQLT